MQSCQCKAFTKRLRPCHNYAALDTQLCRQHASYYDSLDFLERLAANPWLYDVPGSRIADAIKASGAPSKAICKWLEESYYAIGNTLTTQRRYKWLYSMGCYYKGINPLDSMTLWREELGRRIVGWTGVPEETLRRNVDAWIEPLFPQGSDLFFPLCERLCSIGRVPAEGWGINLRVILPMLNMAPVAFMDKEPIVEKILQDAKRYTNSERDAVRTILLTTLEQIKKDYMLSYRVALEPLKEELVATALHPDRICPLIERYGIDVLETAF